MKLYQITFENDVPVSATEITDDSITRVEIELDETQKHIKWMSIFAEHEQDALAVARDVAEKIKGYL
jgi:hypothetical protein